MCDHDIGAIGGSFLGPVGAAAGGMMFDGGGDNGGGNGGFTQDSYYRNNLANFDSFANQYTDPSRYRAMQDEMSANAQSGTANRYASMGLAGSSAAMGAANNQDRLLRMQMMDRQLADQESIARTRMAYSGAINGIDIAKMNMEAQKRAQNMQLLGGILGAGGAVAGTVMGGPAGGAAGAQAGKVVPGQSYTPIEDNYVANNFQSPELGQSSGFGRQDSPWSLHGPGQGSGYAGGYYQP